MPQDTRELAQAIRRIRDNVRNIQESNSEDGQVAVTEDATESAVVGETDLALRVFVGQAGFLHYTENQETATQLKEVFGEQQDSDGPAVTIGLGVCGP